MSSPSITHRLTRHRVSFAAVTKSKQDDAQAGEDEDSSVATEWTVGSSVVDRYYLQYYYAGGPRDTA